LVYLNTDIQNKLKNEDRIEDKLKTHSLRLTDHRKNILNFFIKNPFALSQSFFEEKLSGSCDRITIYRTLRSFLKTGIIHKVLDDSGNIKYALCNENCLPEHHHEHVHFKCERCQRTICLQDVAIPELNLPEGFDGNEISLLVTGICERCS
jgi:Fur family ferric uptake transcriptional regulator